MLPLKARAHSKAKGVSLLEISEMYAHLSGSNIYSTLDLVSSYYLMIISAESQTKSAFVTLKGKLGFKNVPFG